MTEIGDLKKWGHFFAVSSWFAMLGHFWGPFLLPKRPKNAQKRANLVFPATVYPNKTHYEVERQTQAKSEISKNEVIFFSLLRADLTQTSLFDPKNAKISPSPSFWHRFQLHRPIFDRENCGFELFCPFGAVFSCFWACFPTFSPDMTQTSLFDPADAKSSPVPFFWHRFQLRRAIFDREKCIFELFWPLLGCF